MPPCDECQRLIGESGDPLIAHLMVAHDLTLREAELHAQVLLSEQRNLGRLAPA